MDTPGCDKTNWQLSAQRRFFQWAVKWFYTQSMEDTSRKPDVPSLVMLLQAIGFQLREFEKQELQKEDDAPEKETIKIVIKCGTSKMKAVLELDGIDCQCPSDAKEGSLWSICGHAPASNDSISSSKYEETGTNLLPTISKGVNNVVRDVVYRLFKIMNNSTTMASAESGNDLDVFAIGNVEEKLQAHEGLSRSYTQPNFSSTQNRSLNNNSINKLTHKIALDLKLNGKEENVLNKTQDDLETKRKSLQRQKTWDMDLDNGVELKSPKTTSSPTSIDQISLGQLSIASEDECPGFVNYVMRAYNQLDKAVSLLGRKPPFTSSTLSLNDQSFLRPTPPPPRSVANSSINSITSSRLGSVCSMPNRLSQKTTPMKALRRSTASPITQKLAEKSGISMTPTRRPSLTSIPQKAMPSRLSTIKSHSPSMLNSTSTSNKVLPSKTPVRKYSIGANTSLRANSPGNTSFKVNDIANVSLNKTNSVLNKSLKTYSVTNTSLKTSSVTNTSLKINSVANPSPKTNSIANTSLKSNILLKTPTANSKLTPPSSIRNGASRFGFSKK